VKQVIINLFYFFLFFILVSLFLFIFIKNFSDKNTLRKMTKKYFAYATKTEVGTYTLVHHISKEETKIPVAIDKTTAEDKIMHDIMPGRRIQLEGIVLDLTQLVDRGIIPKDKLRVLS